MPDAVLPSAPAPSNLPLALTSFVGREQELADITHLLSITRLLTLTGAGGVGKTRLALEAAARVQDDYEHGVWLVELAALTDPGLVPQVVAGVLGVREVAGQPLLTTLLAALQARRLLVVLDNCEHLIDACAHLAAALLHGCAQLAILATSREALGIGGETAWRVPSLPVPDTRHTLPSEQLAEVEAVRLFAERAQAAQPRFMLTAQNAAVVAEVCQQLDGIPLALELAAARVAALPVEQLATRLGDRFRLLAGGSRTALPRQQTLRATIDWSYDLLSEPERLLLCRLTVFAGGFTIEAAEMVCGGNGIEQGEVLDVLLRLVAKSLALLEEQAGEGRYRLLETVRQYARERLTESGEEQAVRARHATWCLALVEQAEPALLTANQVAWLERLEAEHDNLRAALALCLAHDPDRGLRLAGRLQRFWGVRGYLSEGQRWLEAVLARTQAPTVDRVRALLGAGTLARDRGDLPAAQAWLEEGLALARTVGDRHFIAWLLRNLGQLFLFARHDYQRGRALLEEGLALVRELGDGRAQGVILHNLGMLATWEGDSVRALALLEEALALARAAGDRLPIILALIGLVRLTLAMGEYERADVLAQEALTKARAFGATGFVSVAQQLQARAAHWQGDLERAATLYEAGLAAARAAEDRENIGESLHGLGQVAWLRGEGERALTLLQEGLVLAEAAGDPVQQAGFQRGLGLVAASQGKYDQAATWLRASLERHRELGQFLQIARCLEAFVAVAAGQSQPVRAVRLLGSAAAVRATLGAPLPPVDRPRYEAIVEAARVELGEEAFAAAWAGGQGLTLEQAMAEALGEELTTSADAAQPADPARPPVLHGLTPREIEVVRLLAQGATDGQIAQGLSISVKTVNKHVASILGKTGSVNRTAAAAFAVRHGLGSDNLPDRRPAETGG